MKNTFYVLIQNKNGSVVVSNPYLQNTNMGILCDKARDLSLDNECEVSIYKFFILSPSSTRLLYRFDNGKLIRY